jgi:hypothetical protein
MKKLVIGACMGALVAMAAPAVAGPLDGQTVNVNLTVNGLDYGTQSVLVGAGDEGNYFGDTYFDLNGGANGDEFVYTSTGDFCGINCQGGDVVWTLSNIQGLTGFLVLQQDVGPVTINSLTSSSVSFSYADNSIHQGVNVVGRFQTGSVPEPASWALMLGGFGMVGGAMRSRRKAAVTFA